MNTSTSKKKAKLPPRWFIRLFWSAHRRLYLVSRGHLGLTKPKPQSNKYGIARLTTLGRRTGIDRSVMFGYFDDGPNLVTMASADGRHAASARLLETTRPHILGSLFPQLCQTTLPQGSRVREITRFCLDPQLPTLERREARNVLVSGLVEHALDTGIDTFTGVADMGWFQQILAFGWRCHPLGLPQVIGGRMLAALAIAITAETPSLLAASGIYRPTVTARPRALEAA